MNTESLFHFFNDISELDIVEDEAGILSLTGRAVFRDVEFSVSIKRPKSLQDTSTAAPLLRGTVSLRDPRTGNVLESETKKRSGGKEHSAKATKDVKQRTLDAKALAAAVEKAVSELYAENSDQLGIYGREAIPPGMITPMDAARLYVDKYIRDRYPDGAEEGRKRRAASIRSTAALLPNTPMINFTPVNVEKVIRKHDLSKQRVTDLRLFWEYCLSESICGGSLPFADKPMGRMVRKDYSSLNRAAGSVTALSFDVWCRMLDTLYARPKSAVGCGILLLMSGFSPDFITGLTWSELNITDSTVFVRYYRDELAGSKHVFSRDLFADAAGYIGDYYRALSAEREGEELGTQPVLWSETQKRKLTKKKLTDEAVQLMTVAKASSDDITNIAAYKKALSPSLLTDTYAALLKTRCGLRWDEDSLYFLTGRVLPSSTFSSYESHTDPAARERFRQLMAPLSRPQKIARTVTTASEDSFTLVRYRPGSTDERVTVTGTVTLAPGETLSIRSRYGMEGHVRPVEEGEDENV